MRPIKRRPSSALSLPSLRLEGNLFLPDQLEKAALGKAAHQEEEDYLVPKGLKLKDEYSRAFQIASAQWRQFATRIERHDIDASELTKRFVIELLRDALGYNSLQLVEGKTIGERHYPVDALAENFALLIAPHNLPLDVADARFAVGASGVRKKSAFQLTQEFLNADSNCLWAIVSNGKQLRLLRDASTLTRPSFLEFDVADMLQGQRFAEFMMAWHLLHASRAGINSIWEKWRGEGLQDGTRVREGLRKGVTQALITLGSGFLTHSNNDSLRSALLRGEVSLQTYYEQLLRLVYRFIFLFTVEERGLLHADEQGEDGGEVHATPSNLAARYAYAQGYALARLRDRCLHRRAYNHFDDIWRAISIVFRGLAIGEPRLALPALGGLFAPEQCTLLDGALLTNATLLQVMKELRWSNHSGNVAAVDYRNMGPEELGSVYEGLLELVPSANIAARQFGFVGYYDSPDASPDINGRTGKDSKSNKDSNKGNERKTTGSYYTPDSLVQELIKSTLDPVIAKRIQTNPANPVQALLSIKVIDPACGSGHFLLAAARRLAEKLAALRAPDGAIRPQDYRHALREVVGKCIFGVDRNPMALELARTALWLEGYEPGAALSFLDHHLQCGDALIGLTDLKQMANGIPDTAFKPLAGDDRNICKELIKANREGLKAFAKDSKQLSLALEEVAGLVHLQSIEAMPDSSVEEGLARAHAYHTFLQEAKNSRLAQAADMYIGAFLSPKANSAALLTCPTSKDLYFELFTQLRSDAQLVKLQAAQKHCETARIFHWPLAFAQVFAQGGFDCVLANPPWERIKLQEEEFFANRHALVALAKNKAERGIRIEWLKDGTLACNLYPNQPHPPAEALQENALYAEFITALRIAEASSVYAHIKKEDGGRYPLTGVGDINTYALFAECINQIVAKDGRAGFIVPTGIATDDSTKAYFAHIVQKRKLSSLYDFENRDGLFPGVHRSYKFSLLTLGQAEKAEFAFFLTNPNQLHDERRRFALTAEDFRRINPNTRTCPIFRSHKDAELTSHIYTRTPVLIREALDDVPEQNPWGISFMAMFHMANDSHLFKNEPALDCLPLYEAKMIHQFDHRWANYTKEGGKDIVSNVSLEAKSDTSFCVSPRYWLKIEDIHKRLAEKGWTRKWLMGWRDITNVTNERTVIASVMPCVATGDTILLMFPDQTHGRKVAALLADQCSLVHDFVARQKVGGIHLKYHVKKQITVLPPDAYDEKSLDFIVPRVLELTYTTDDLQQWALELGYDGPPFIFNKERRAEIRNELDAWYAHAYGLARDDLHYILDPTEVMGANYPSETFRVWKNSEIREFGEFRSANVILYEFDRMAIASATNPYQSRLTPPPGELPKKIYSSLGIIKEPDDALLIGLIFELIRTAKTLPSGQIGLVLAFCKNSKSQAVLLDKENRKKFLAYCNTHKNLFADQRTVRLNDFIGFLEKSRTVRRSAQKDALTWILGATLPNGGQLDDATEAIVPLLLQAVQSCVPVIESTENISTKQA